MLRLILKWWHSMQRDMDLKLLWPSFKKQAPNLETARTGFIVHMSMCSCYHGLSEEELAEFVREKLV